MSMQDIVLRYMPNPHLGKEMQLIELEKGSTKYNEVFNLASYGMKQNIIKIEEVHNPVLFGWYLIKKGEYECQGYKNCERTLFHVTAAANIPSIMKSNLDWRRVSRHKFGRGVSFSNDADYANKYADFKIGTERAMIVADVLVGKTAPGDSVQDLPPEGVDTTTGNDKVFVKFYDDEFYPKYIIYYKCLVLDRNPLRYRNMRFRY